jgi:DNA-directed RNA polymerase subunit RPC12/RpoP
MPKYRCFCCASDAGQLGRDFEVAAGQVVACPECGEKYTPPSGPNEPYAGHVAEVVPVHFDRPKNVRRGVGFAACNPKIRAGCGQMFSGDPVAVTCGNCRQTVAWKEAAAARGLPVVLEEADVVVMLNPLTGAPASEPAGT